MSGTDFGRRQFLKIAGAVAAGGAMSAALVGCSAGQGQGGGGTAGAEGDHLLGWSDISFAQDVDVLVVGSGPSGLAAAYTATKAGANTLVIDKQPSYGGAAANAANGWVAPESEVCAKLRPNEAISMDDNLAAFKEAYANNPDYYDWYEAVELGLDKWFTTVVDDFGAEFMEAGHECSYGGFFLPPEGVGEANAIWSTVYEHVQAAGAQFMFNMKADTFIMDENETLVGLRCYDSTNMKWVDIKARAIILATGGFAANMEMITQYYPDYANKGCIVTQDTGDGHALAQSIGGQLNFIEYGNLPDGSDPAWGACNYNPHLENIHVAQTMGRSFSILPTTGRRFYDETMVHEAPFACLGAGAYSWWAIWDKDINEGPNTKSVKRAVEETKTGNSVEELAAAMQMPVDVIQAAFDEYAQICAAGVDNEFGRTMFLENLEPPYYALQVFPVRYKTHGGLKVSAAHEVLDASNAPIPGLYASGIVAGTVHILPAGGSGWVAGENAAAYAMGQ